MKEKFHYLPDKIWIRIIAEFKIYKLFNLFIPFLRIDKKKVVFSNFRGRGFGDNPKYIAEELHRNYPDMHLVWLESRLKGTGEFPSYIRVVNLNSFRSLYELATAKFWVDNHRKNIFIKKRKGQYYIQLWHGALISKAIEKDTEDRLEVRYIAEAKRDSENIDICVAGTRQLHDIYQNSFWYNGKIIDVGSPRNDILFELDSKKIYALKNRIGIGNKKICLYAPTFRNNGDATVYNLDYEKLKTTLEKSWGGDWALLVRLHPQMLHYKAVLNIPNFVLDVSAYPDSQELLSISDCVITDYSSFIYDFALTNRPALIYAPDYEKYTTSDRRLYFSLCETPFPIAFTNDELTDNIQKFDLATYRERLESFNTRFGVFDKGTASKAVCELIKKNIDNTKKEMIL